jgi:hypothetical protein
MKHLIASLVTVAIAGAAHAEINFSKSVPSEQKKLLTRDMFFLANQPYPSDSKLAQMMEIPSTDGLTILNWIDNRMVRIVGEDFELEKNIAIVNQSFFPEPSETPSIPTVVNTPGGSSGGGKVQTVMSNLGGAVYISGKMSHVMFSLKVDDNKINITSPRLGVFKVGEGLFNTQLTKSPADSKMSTYFRLATLVHEARHSDGRGRSAGFLHAICPTGHRFAGYAGCDASSNGPYTIEGQFLKVAIQNCKDCQPGELELMNKMMADSFSRMVIPAAQPVDTSVYPTIISSYQLLLSFCQKTPSSCTPEQKKQYEDAIANAQAAMQPQAAPTEAPRWDANPEGTYPTVSRDNTWSSIYQLNAKTK